MEEKFGDRVFSADMVARGKPHPDIFLFAAGKLGVSPDRCLVIEDSAGGIKAAVAAGMTAVGLCAASHIREGHDVKLRDAGRGHLAQSWARWSGSRGGFSRVTSRPLFSLSGDRGYRRRQSEFSVANGLLIRYRTK